MNPSLHAAADRFVYDVATLKHALSLLEDADLDRRSESTGWTVRATFGHLTESQTAYAAALARFAAGSPPLAEFDGDTDPVAYRAALPARHAATPREAIDASLNAGRDAFVAALGDLPSPPSTGAPRRKDVEHALAHASSHAREHGLDLLEAAEPLRLDAVVVTWALGQPFDGPELESRRRALLPVIRKSIEAARKARKKGEN